MLRPYTDEGRFPVMEHAAPLRGTKNNISVMENPNV